MADVGDSSLGEEMGIVNNSDATKDNMFLMDEYDKAAVEVFQEYGVDPEAPAEDDCLNPVYRSGNLWPLVSFSTLPPGRREEEFCI